MRLQNLFALLITLLLLAGCAVNPVTGRNELALIPESKELGLGAEQYAPSRQSQGGDYTTHSEVSDYVAGVGKRLAAVSDRALPYEFSVINDSTPNAWALPGGKIAVNRGLLTELKNEAELAAVLGHEIVHAAARHGAKGMERGILLQGAVMAAGIATSNSAFSDLVGSGAGAAAQLVTQKYGRDAESESDYYGMKYMHLAGYDPRAAIGLQETFVRLSEGKKQDWISGLFSSHPPSQERVEANRQTALDFPPGGEVAEERYRKSIAPLLTSKDAYAAYDEGGKAIAKGELDNALSLADKAIAKEPAEAMFYGLKGDVRFKQGRHEEAVAQYDRALQLNGDYFRYYQQRGLAREKLGQKDLAHADLEQSVKRLPTATALNALGNLFLARGDRQKATQYYASAAGSASGAGKEASRSLLRLDLPENPHKYLKAELVLERSGYLAVRVSNPTPEAISDIAVNVAFIDAAGRRHSIPLAFSGTLASQRTAQVSTGVGPIKDASEIRGAQATVVRARLVEQR